jgi:short-subunit dehydrogenase
VELRGKRVLITGASSGIGAALARELAAAGAHLVLSARRVPELEALAAELGAHGTPVEVVPGDLASTEGANALADAVGAVDILVNNAGIDLASRPWKPGNADKGDKLLQVNLLSPLRLTNRLLGPMVERKSGALVFVSSVSAWNPFPSAHYYAASKAALAAAAETLRIDLRGTGVHVLTVYPGPIRTPMLEQIKPGSAVAKFFAPLPKGKPDELARRVVDALLADERQLVYPAIYAPSRWLAPLGGRLIGLLAPAPRKS